MSISLSTTAGVQGIAVGMATNIPPHNMGEVVAALEALIRDPDITTAQLMDHIPGPDFPTGLIMPHPSSNSPGGYCLLCFTFASGFTVPNTNLPLAFLRQKECTTGSTVSNRKVS